VVAVPDRLGAAMSYPESAMDYQFGTDDSVRRSPLLGRKLPRLKVVDGVTLCHCGLRPVAIWSRRCCHECDRVYTRARRARVQGPAGTR